MKAFLALLLAAAALLPPEAGAGTYCNGAPREGFLAPLYPSGAPTTGGLAGLYPNGKSTLGIGAVLYPNGASTLGVLSSLYPNGRSTTGLFSCAGPNGESLIADSTGLYRARARIPDFGLVTVRMGSDCVIQSGTFEHHENGYTVYFDVDFKTGAVSNVDAVCD